MESKSDYRYNPELIEAVLSNQDVDATAKQLMKRKEDECSAYCRGIREERETLDLLLKSLGMPAGSAGKILADVMLEQLRTDYPDAAKKADAYLARKAEIEAAEIERICAH